VPAAEISHSGGEDRTSFDRPFPGCPGLSQPPLSTVLSNRRAPGCSVRCAEGITPAAQCAFKMSMFVSCSSHEDAQFAASFIDPLAD